MEVLLRFLYGTTAVMAVPRRSWRSWRCRGDPTADWPNPRWPAEVLNMFKVSAVPREGPQCWPFSAVLRRSLAEPRRYWRCHCGLCRTSTAVAPRPRCDGTRTAEAPRNMLKVAAVPPRRSAVLTVFRGATTINDGTTAIMAVPLRFMPYKHRSGTAPPCDGGITVVDSTSQSKSPSMR